MVINKENAYLHVLCMDLTEACFRVSILNKSSKLIVFSASFLLLKFDKEEVAAVLNQDYFKFDYDSFVLSAGTVRNTLVPVDLFAYSKPEEIFKLNFADPVDNLDYNRIPELGIVNIYELPFWIKSLFVVRMPRVKIVHRSTVLLKGIFDQDSYFGKIHLLIEEEQFYLLLTKQSKLVCFNRFDYKELADIIYYVLFVLEQKELAQKDFEMNLYGVPADWKEFTEFKSFFSSKIILDSIPEKGALFLLAKQILCA